MKTIVEEVLQTLLFKQTFLCLEDRLKWLKILRNENKFLGKLMFVLKVQV